MSFLIVGLLLPGVYVALTPAPAEAQWFNTTIFDVTAIVNFIKQIADKVWEVTQLALEIALYKTVKYAVRQLGDQSAQWVGRTISGGAVGQEPLFWEQNPQQMLEQAGEAAGGFFIEGMAESIAADQQGGSGPLKDRRAKGNRGAILQQAQQIVNQMCNPDPKFKFDLLAGIIGNLSISIGLPIPPLGLPPIPGTKKTEKPACTFTQAYSSWKKVVEDTAQAYNNQLLGAIDMAKNLPNQLKDSFNQDIQDINNQLQDLMKIDLGSPTAQADLQRKLTTLQDSIEAKTGVYFTGADAAIDISGGTNALNVLKSKTGDAISQLSNDPSIKSQLDAIDLTLAGKTGVRANNLYSKLISSLNTEKDQKIAATAEEVKKMEDRVREIQNARRTGKPTGWQVLQDLTDPSKASDQAVNSRVQDTLQRFLAKMHEATVLQRTETGGPKPQTTLSGQVTSPPFTVAALVSGSIAGQVNQEGKFTGNAVVDAADLIGEFADSIFAKSGQMIMEGLTKTLADQPVAQQSKIDELAQKIADEQSRTTQQLGTELDTGSFYGGGGGGTTGGTGTGGFGGGGEPGVAGGTTGGGTPGVDIPFPEPVDEGADIAAETTLSGGGGAPGGTTGGTTTGGSTTGGTGGTTGGSILGGTFGTVLRPLSDLITNPSASIQAVRRASIEARISRLVALPPSKEEQINVVSSLQSDCVPGSPDSCTIRPPFAQAIQNKLTIAEAVRKYKQTGGSMGLDENAIFGFKRSLGNQPIEPDLANGIPYSSMVVLRKYRILPVAWELTALYIRDHPAACGQQNCTLRDVMNQFDTSSSPFYKLIDPHWLLKSPAAKCMLKGYGPPIEQKGTEQGSTNENAQWICRGDPSEDRGTEGTPPNVTAKQCKVEYKIQPRSQICLNEQTCLDEDASGRCKAFGYCLEEKKRWQFSGTECKKRYSSCLSFTNTATGVTASFLRDSLPSANLGYGSVCSASAAGCAWQSKTLELKAGSSGSMKSDYNWKEGDKVYFTPKTKDLSCSAEAEGCSALVRQSDVVNFAPQSDTLGNSTGWCGGSEGSWSRCEYGSPRSTITWSQVTDQMSPNGVVEPVGKISRTPGSGEYRIHLHKRSHGLDSVIGKTFTFSLWAKAAAATSISLRLGADGDQGNQDCSISTEWTRCSVTKPILAANAPKYSTQDELRAYLYTSTGDVFVYGAQVELSSFPTDYVKNTPIDRPGTTYAKVAPSYYGCDQNLTESDPAKLIGYKKDICKGFALHCPASYAGCSAYTPVNGDPPVSGVQPLACDAACVGLTRFVQLPNQLETITTPTPLKPSYDFIASTAQMCTADQVGCDEYTNLEGGAAGGGEQRDYYKALTKCVKKLANPEDQRAARQDVFYSWTGSETGGTQLEKFLVVSKNDTAKSPECWKNPPAGMHLAGNADTCECDKNTNGPGRPLCRQFFRLKPDGSADTTQSWWRIQDDLIYATESADCVQYRRTADGATSTNRYYISKSMSKTCSSASNGCREYHASQAGNMTALPPDTFTDKTIGKWMAGPDDAATLSLSATGEGETLGDTSLKALNSAATKQAITIQRPVALRSGSVLLGFGIKGSANSKLSIRLVNSPESTAVALSAEQVQQAGSSTLNTDILNGSWQYFQFAFSNVTIPEGSAPHIRITLDKNSASNLNQFYLDDVTVRQSDGILYVIKDSWHGRAPQQCYVNATAPATGKNWDTGVADALSCQTYTDKDGNRSTFMRFTTLCPKEMVGCMQFLRADVSGSPVSLVDDPKKYCKKEFNKCTAYGIPQFDAKKTVVGYRTAYYTIAQSEINETNPDYTKGMCKPAEAECQEYATKYSNEYFKNPGANVARWRPATTSEKANFPDGVWYYMTCEGTSTKCLSDSQCSDGKACKKEEKVAATDLTLARLCPSSQSTCSTITDPECRQSDPQSSTYLTLRTNYGRMGGESGITCQREYHYLDDVYGATGQCNSSINAEAGCLLFQSDYLRDKKTPAKYNTEAVYAAGKDVVLSAATATGTLDANALIKVKLDRACKTWLGCSDELIDDKGSKQCIARRPCIELDENGECANFVDIDPVPGNPYNKVTTMPELKGEFNIANVATDTKFSALSGLSRPVFKFGNEPISNPSGSVTVIPHDGYFDWSGSSSSGKVTMNIARAVAGTASSQPAAIVASTSCRSIPQKDAPTRAQNALNKALLPEFNECRYERDGNSYRGLEGFCLEGYAKPGFEKYCLNWFPTDKPQGVAELNLSPTGSGVKAYGLETPTIQNYCVNKDTKVTFQLPTSAWSYNSTTELVAAASSNMTNDETRVPAGTNNPNGSDSLDPEPEDEMLTFELKVNKAGNNSCAPYGVNASKPFLCGNAPEESCASLGSQCTSTSTSADYCGLVSSKKCTTKGNINCTQDSDCGGTETGVCRVCGNYGNYCYYDNAYLSCWYSPNSGATNCGGCAAKRYEGSCVQTYTCNAVPSNAVLQTDNCTSWGPPAGEGRVSCGEGSNSPCSRERSAVKGTCTVKNLCGNQSISCTPTGLTITDFLPGSVPTKDVYKADIKGYYIAMKNNIWEYLWPGGSSSFASLASVDWDCTSNPEKANCYRTGNNLTKVDYTRGMDMDTESTLSPYSSDGVTQKFPPCKAGKPWMKIIPVYNTSNKLLGFKGALCSDVNNEDKWFKFKIRIDLKHSYTYTRVETRRVRQEKDFCIEFAEGIKDNKKVIPMGRIPGSGWSARGLTIVPSTQPGVFAGKDHYERRTYIATRKEDVSKNNVGVLQTQSASDSYATDYVPNTSTELTLSDNADTGHFMAINDIRTKQRIAKLYTIYRLNLTQNGTVVTPGSYASVSADGTLKNYWDASLGSTQFAYPHIGRGACSNDRACTANDQCGAGNTCAIAGENTFNFDIPRESSNQQQATLSFYAWAGASQEPLRRLSINWGDKGIWTDWYNTVPDGDNVDGFEGRNPSSDFPETARNAFRFTHTYSRSFWSGHKTMANDVPVCVAIQDNWYSLNKVCRKYYLGSDGFVRNNGGWYSEGKQWTWTACTGSNTSTCGANTPKPLP